MPGSLIFEQHRVIPSLLFYSHGSAAADVHEDDGTSPHYDVYTTGQAAHFPDQPPECGRARVIVARSGDYVLVREIGMPQYCDPGWCRGSRNHPASTASTARRPSAAAPAQF